MAVIFRGKAIFLEHPRTGSTALREALKRIGGQPHERHAYVKAKQDEKTVVVVRNPFDVLISWWLIVGEREGYTSLADFLVRCRDRQLMTKGGRLFYYIDHADIVMRYEHFDRDLAETLTLLKLPQVRLKQRNATPRKLPYRNYYTPKDITIVRDIYGEELERLGYTF